MTKADLVEEVFRNTNLPKNEIVQITDSLLEEIKNALCIERHGYDLAEQDRRRWATDTRADIEALERELVEKREYLKELER